MAMAYRLLLLVQTIICCYAAVNPDWDYFIFTQQWPPSVCNEGKQERHATCRIPSSINYWTIHGLWPQGNTEPDCPDTPPFDFAAIKDLLPELNQYWPDIFVEKVNTTFWKHEWMSHGTCASSLPATKNERLYFKKSLELRQKFGNLKEELAKCGIKPSTTQAYQMQGIVRCFQARFPHSVYVRCFKNKNANRHELVETRICLDKTFTLMPCRNYLQEDGSLQKSEKCPKNGIYLLPIDT